MKNALKIIACVLLWQAATAFAQDSFPSRPIRWIVPAPPGGGTDAVSRIVAPKLTEL